MADVTVERRAAAERISTALLWVSGVGLCISFLVLLYLMHISPPRRNHLGFVPGLAFWGGILLSGALYVSGFRIDGRLRSIVTMIVAVLMALTWILVAFFSLALMD